MNSSSKLASAITAACLLCSSIALPIVANGAEIDGKESVIESSSGYSFSVAGNAFEFFDYDHKISILGNPIPEGVDLSFDGSNISYYGLNDDGNLATVYFNTQADEGKGIVASNDEMIYISYDHGTMTEVVRNIGTIQLFGFDMSLADPSLPGMMKVFTASLGSFVQAWGATSADYSAVSNSTKLSGKVEYVKGKPVSLLLMDDNYITNLAGSPNEAFMANELGIYSGYQVVDGVDYNTFCFFGTNCDLYYYGYAPTNDGFKVLAMKGSVSQISDRVKSFTLNPVDMTKACDNSSQYLTKMASSLMAAQNYTSMNLDTIKLKKSLRLDWLRLSTVIEVSTATASGTLTYSNGVYSGELKDAKGNTEKISVTLSGKNFVVSALTTGVFTVACKDSCGSLNEANPTYNTKPNCRFSLTGLLLDWIFDWAWF